MKYTYIATITNKHFGKCFKTLRINIPVNDLQGAAKK